MSNSENKRWVTTVVKDPDSGDYLIEIPDDLMLAANLKIGDVMQYETKGNCVILNKVSKTRVLIHRLRNAFMKFLILLKIKKASKQ